MTRLRHIIAGLIAALLLASPAAAQTRAVAVTFDDLPYQRPGDRLCDPVKAMKLTTDFVAMLRPLNAKATAFINEGKVCEAQRATLLPAILSVWLDAGVELGNHTFSHLNIHQTTPEAWLADVDAGAVITRSVLASRGLTLRWFRHPYLFTGETEEKKAALAAGLAERGYAVAPVTIDNSEWLYAAVYREAAISGDAALMARIGEAYIEHIAAVLDHFEPYSAELTGGREPAQVLLLHANELNRDWYPKIHALLLARGYRFVSLEEALKDPAYGHPDAWIGRRGISWLHRWRFTDGLPIHREPDPPAWIMQAYEALD